MEMPTERKFQRRESLVTVTHGRSAKDKMNLLGELSTISLAAGKIGEEAIIVELLLALPIKSLIRFKCVCKSWCTFISDPQFGRSHLKRCILQNPNSTQRLLFGIQDITDNNTYKIKSLDYERSKFEPFEIANDKLSCPIRFRLPIPPKSCRIVGSCDGLVCLLPLYDLRRIIVIWNPTTGAFKEIQPPAANFDMLGFGYDRASSDYKIVTSIRKSNDVLVFSLKGESWRAVCQMLDLNCTCGVYLNGCLHWLTTKFQLGVVCFDLSEEEFHKVIPLPDGIITNVYSSLIVLRGCLCLHSCGRGLERLHKCYIMGEYGLKSSWSELEVPVFNMYGFSYPVCIRSDGKVLGFLKRSIVSKKNDLYLYSAEDNSCQTASLWDIVTGAPRLYVESLVSP